MLHTTIQSNVLTLPVQSTWSLLNSRNSSYALACNSSGSVGGSTRFMKTSALKGVGPSVRKNGFYRLGLSFINFRRLKWSRPSLKFCRSCIRLSTSSSTRIEVIKSPFDFKFSTLPTGHPERLTIVLYFGSSNRLFMSSSVWASSTLIKRNKKCFKKE